MSKALAVLQIPLLLAVFVASPAQAGSQPALLSQVQGRVDLVSASPGDSRAEVRSLQLLGGGSGLKLAAGAEVVVICSDDRALRLTGPAEWRPEAPGCTAGRQLPAGTYRRMVPAQGRVRDFHGSLLAEAPSRSDFDELKVPTLLSPRSSQRGSALIGEAKPVIVWNQVADALEYRLILQRGGSERVHSLAPTAAVCERDPRSRMACHTPWPWPALEEGEEVELKVLARVPDPNWPERSSDASSLKLAPVATCQQVAARLEGLKAAGLPPASLELLRADAYVEAGLYNEAAAALAASIEERLEPAVAVRLGDLYLGLGLLGAARGSYEQAGKPLLSTGDDEIWARIKMGLGRTYIRGKDPEAPLAIRHFERAEQLYRKLGMTIEADEAAKEAELAGRGLS